jgi:Protein of unknown function (DUF2567)
VSVPILESPPTRRARTIAAGFAVGLAVAALGAPLGLLWSAIAPDVPVVKTEEGGVLADPQPEQFIASDGSFAFLGLAFGVLAAVVVWLVLRRYRGPLGLVAVVLGAVAAGLLAWGIGRQIGLEEYRRALESAPVGATLSRPPDLRAAGFPRLYGLVPTIQGDVLLPAFGASVTYTLLAGWSKSPSLRPEPEAPDDARVGATPLSWRLSAPPAPTTAPAPPAPDATESPRE